jgi:hypothetical protein
MLELLPLAALRLILNRSAVTTTSLEMPLMTINGHNRREWIVADTRARPLTLSGRFLRYVPTDRLRPGSDPDRLRPGSDPVMPDVTLRVPFGCGRGDAARVVRSSCRVADYAWQRNAPPGGTRRGRC